MRRRTERAIGTAARGLPCASGQRRTGIKGIQAHARREVFGLKVGAKTTRGPNTGDSVLRRIGRIQRQPLLPGGLQKSHIALAVDALKQRVVKTAWRLQRPQRARLQGRQYLVLPLGHFVAGHHAAAVHLQFALVGGMIRVVKNMHGASLQEDARQRSQTPERRL